MYTCTSVDMRLCKYVCMYTCAYVRMYIGIHVLMYICMWLGPLSLNSLPPHIYDVRLWFSQVTMVYTDASTIFQGSCMGGDRTSAPAVNSR